jgi:ABC-type Fe3+/spermidine/putrescine transport system ATPase subunit
MSARGGVPTATSLTLLEVSHSYDGHELTLDRVSLSVRDGEFLTLLGPSGCGKTTLLRTIAGFIRPHAGSVVLHGADVTRLPPHRRPVNMVFQRVTLFPHLDVFGNVAFGLQVTGVPRSEIQRRVDDALELVRLGGYGKRRSDELSGGQMQRVALARALVNRPKVLLLDEPLSALDLEIRLEMEVELRQVHRETGATFVYVTHDQREALALSDRIALFNHGRIEQIDAPDALYRRPASVYAARFVGGANVLPAQVHGTADGSARISVQDYAFVTERPGLQSGSTTLVIRQEALQLTTGSGNSRPGLKGVVRDVAFRGSGFTYLVEVEGLARMLKAEVPATAGPAIDVGAEVTVSWHPDSVWLLPGERANAVAEATAEPEPVAEVVAQSSDVSRQ